MKRLLALAVLGMALCAAQVQASGCGPGCNNGPFNFGVKVWFGNGSGGCPGTLGPWYQYWPQEAYFQVPAHPQYPYWGSPQVLPNGAPVAAPAIGPSPYGGH
jgi:hypothetical protein